MRGTHVVSELLSVTMKMNHRFPFSLRIEGHRGHGGQHYACAGARWVRTGADRGGAGGEVVRHVSTEAEEEERRRNKREEEREKGGCRPQC